MNQGLNLEIQIKRLTKGNTEHYQFYSAIFGTRVSISDESISL